jgi:hypothetical protein
MLARAIKRALSGSYPLYLGEGEWHLPYIETRRVDGKIIYVSQGVEVTLDQAKAISASCCAQVSYRKLDTSIEKAQEIFHKLIEMKPAHASPVEHQATPIITEDQATHRNLKTGQLWCNNFRLWQQYRHELGI